MQKNVVFFVKTDLLLQEKGFKALRNFFKDIGNDVLEMYCSIDDISDKNGLLINSLHIDLLRPNINNLVLEKILSGYILTDVKSLKKLLSI